MTTVIFACVHNAGRSQMATAFFNALADPTKAWSLSAGTAPAACVHPEVLAAMAEVGLDLRAVTPRLLTAAMAAEAQLLVTMGEGRTVRCSRGYVGRTGRSRTRTVNPRQWCDGFGTRSRRGCSTSW